MCKCNVRVAIACGRGGGGMAACSALPNRGGGGVRWKADLSARLAWMGLSSKVTHNGPEQLQHKNMQFESRTSYAVKDACLKFLVDGH